MLGLLLVIMLPGMRLLLGIRLGLLLLVLLLVLGRMMPGLLSVQIIMMMGRIMMMSGMTTVQMINLILISQNDLIWHSYSLQSSSKGVRPVGLLKCTFSYSIVTFQELSRLSFIGQGRLPPFEGSGTTDKLFCSFWPIDRINK